MRTVPAGEFKAKCLALMDEVQATGQPILLTKRGRPVASLMPVESATAQNPETAAGKLPIRQGESPHLTDKASIFGRLRHMGVITGDIVSSELENEEWDRLFDEKWARFEKGSAR